MIDDTVSKICSKDFPLDWLVDDKGDGFAGPVSTVIYLIPESY